MCTCTTATSGSLFLLTLASKTNEATSILHFKTTSVDKGRLFALKVLFICLLLQSVIVCNAELKIYYRRG